MVVRALDHVARCYTSGDGAVVAEALRKAFADESRVTLSFDGVSEVPSSFINAALVPFVKEHSFEWVKDRLLIVEATKQIAEMVRRCLSAANNARRA